MSKRKKVPGDWCRVNGNDPKLTEKMFGYDKELGGDGHFVRIISIGRSPFFIPYCHIRCQYAKEDGASIFYAWFYPKSCLTFLFHED